MATLGVGALGLVPGGTLLDALKHRSQRGADGVRVRPRAVRSVVLVRDADRHVAYAVSS